MLLLFNAPLLSHHSVMLKVLLQLNIMVWLKVAYLFCGNKNGWQSPQVAFMVPQKQLEMVRLPLKTSWLWSLQKQLEMVRLPLRNSQLWSVQKGLELVHLTLKKAQFCGYKNNCLQLVIMPPTSPPPPDVKSASNVQYEPEMQWLVKMSTCNGIISATAVAHLPPFL